MLDAYLEDVRAALRPALCLHSNFFSPHVEIIKPEIEIASCRQAVLPPVTIESANGEERCLVEQAINSTRVSFAFKAVDAVEELLARTFLKFMMHRAEQLDIVRRVPVPGYQLSFLITAAHLERMHRERLLDFICQFVQSFHAETSGMKLGLATRNRAIVDQFWALAQQQRRQQQQQAAAADKGQAQPQVPSAATG